MLAKQGTMLAAFVLVIAGAHRGHTAESKWPMPLEAHAIAGTSSVTSFAMTGDGFVWVGSARGLCRWDGTALKCFDGHDAMWPAFAGQGVNALEVTADGTLWIGAQEGLWSYSANAHFVRQTPSDVSALNESILCLQAAGESLWVASVQGLHLRSQGKWEHRAWPEDNFAGKLQAVRGDAEGNARLLVGNEVWWAHKLALSFALDKIRSEPAAPGASDAAEARHAWIGAPVDNWPLETPRVLGALTARDGRQWVSTYEGIFTRSAGAPLPGTPVPLPATAFEALREDRQGNIWTSGFGSTLFRISSPRRSTLVHDDGQTDAGFAVVQSKTGAVYVSQGAGLSIYADHRHTLITPRQGLPSYAIRSLTLDAQNNLWMTTLSDGIIKFDGAEFTRYTTAQGLPTDRWIAIGASGLSVYVAGQNGSVLLINATDGTWQRVAGVDTNCDMEKPCAKRVRAISASSGQRRVWFCTESQGLVRLWGQALKVFGREQGLQDEHINYVAEDERGLVWVGTPTGLFRIREDKATWYGAEAGMPTRSILQIVSATAYDGKPELWFGTKEGVMRVDRASLDDVAERRRKHVDVQRYTVDDGLLSDETIGSFHPGALAAADGLVWFSSLRGPTLFDSHFVVPRPPPVHIDSVSSNGHVIAQEHWRSHKLSLAAGTQDLQVSYVAPVHIDAQRVHYDYRLFGLESNWTHAKNRQTAYYTQLGPGDYKFEVKASVDGGTAPSSTSTLSLYIAPHFYQTRLFMLACIASALALIAATMRLRSRHLAARYAAIADERARISRDFHDTLGQIFAASGLQLDSLERAAPAGTGIAERIRQIRQTLSHGKLAARRALWNVRQTGDPAAFARPFIKTLRELGALYEDVSLVVVSAGQEWPLPHEAENQILRIAEEAVSNAVSHGRAERVTIEIQYHDDGFSLWVRDDGGGFDTSSALGQATFEGGLGLVGMRERAKAVGAELQVHSEPGVGSEVGVFLKKRSGKTKVTRS